MIAIATAAIASGVKSNTRESPVVMSTPMTYVVIGDLATAVETRSVAAQVLMAFAR
jgi:hypothetical protein